MFPSFLEIEKRIMEELDEEYEEEESLESSSFVCEDCDYRWEDNLPGEDWEPQNLVCPMCGSVNVTQL